MQISVIIVTHNPRADLLAGALDSIDNQTLPKSLFEIIVVDNACVPPLRQAELKAGRGFDPIVITEPRLGISFARRAGIKVARGDILVFVDDDNRLSTDYLERALKIAAQKPEIGAFGGICTPLFEGAMAPWKAPLLPYLGVRDHGPDAITSGSGDWGKWDPIGAGMVIRRLVGLQFVQILDSAPSAARLGRRGSGLLSGEDTLIARAAWMSGYACSYEPELKLEHVMKARRLTAPVLARTLLGHGRSYVVLQQLLGRPTGKLDWLLPVRLMLSYGSRLKADGLRAGTISWFWDLGRALELFQSRSRPADLIKLPHR